MKVEKENIINAIRKLNIGNSITLIHSSLKSFGQVEGGADTVINSFLECGCTIIVPTFSYDYEIFSKNEKLYERNGIEQNNDISWQKAVGVFRTDSLFISSDMGIIPKTILNRKESIRGFHPVNSLSAIGPLAKEIIKNQSPLNVYGAYQYIFDHLNAYIILMGVDFTKATPVHFAELLTGRNLFRRWYLNQSNIPTEMVEGSCSEGFNNFLPYLKPINKGIEVGKSLWQVFPFKHFIQICADVIKDNPEITHCGKACVRCDDMIKGGPIISK